MNTEKPVKARRKRGLDQEHTFTLNVRSPYRLDLTATVLRRLSTPVIDLFDERHIYRRIIGDTAHPTLLSVVQATHTTLRVTLTGTGMHEADAAALVTHMLGTSVDLSPFYRAAKSVRWLMPLVSKALGVKPPCYPSVWETCVNSIVYQQISIFAAASILRRMIERFAEPITIGGETLRMFPGPNVILAASIEELHGAGLSANKVASIRGIASALLDGVLDERHLATLPTQELMTSLTTLPGVGPWTAAVVALRGFGRLDLFPMNDSGAGRNLRELSGGQTIDMESLLEKLGEQRGMLYYHLLLNGLSERGEVTL